MESEPFKQVPLRVPQSWIPEMDQAAKKRFMSRNGFLLTAIRRVLDGEKK